MCISPYLKSMKYRVLVLLAIMLLTWSPLQAQGKIDLSHGFQVKVNLQKDFSFILSYALAGQRELFPFRQIFTAPIFMVRLRQVCLGDTWEVRDLRSVTAPQCISIWPPLMDFSMPTKL